MVDFSYSYEIPRCFQTWIDGRTGGQTNEWTDGRMDRLTDKQRDMCVRVARWLDCWMVGWIGG